jgi:hypothetical protein
MGTNPTRICSKKVNTAIVTTAVPLLDGYSIPGKSMGFLAHSVQTSSSDHPYFYPMDIRGSSLSGRGEKLTTHLGLVPMLEMCAPVPPLPPCVLMAWCYQAQGLYLYLHGLQFSKFVVQHQVPAYSNQKNVTASTQLPLHICNVIHISPYSFLGCRTLSYLNVKLTFIW